MIQTYRYFTHLLKLLAIASFIFILLTGIVKQVQAAAGINKVINFQGKVVNSNGTNVTDGTYDFVVKIYDGAGNAATALFTESWTAAALWSGTMNPAPGTTDDTLTYVGDTNEATLKVGQLLTNTTKSESVVITSVNTSTNVLGISRTRQAWADSDTITNKIYVKNGVFRVGVNSLNVDLSAVDFNSDTLFFGINFNADGEMKPRIQYTAVPYAFNAEKVNGLSISGTSGAITLGTSTHTLSFTTSNNTAVTLPTTGTLATLAGTETLTGKTIGTGGLTFTGADTDITTTSNQDFIISPNGTGLVGIANATPRAMLDVTGSASVSANLSLGVSGTTTGGLVFYNATNYNYTKFQASASQTQAAITYTLPVADGTNGQVLATNGSGGLSWATATGGSSKWTADAGIGDGLTYLTEVNDDVAMGGSALPTTASSTTTFFMDVSTGILYLGNDVNGDTGINGGLTFYSSGDETDPTILAESDGDLTISATGGTVNIGSGTGNITLSLTAAADAFTADKTVTLGGAYSGIDYTYSRVLTGGTNNQGGTLFKIIDSSTATSGTLDSTLLLVNSAITGGGSFTGNLLKLQVSSTDKFVVDSTGGLTMVGGNTADVTTSSNNNFTILPNGTGDTVLKGDADSNIQVTFGAAPGVDMVAISNSGQGTSTTGVDGLSVTYVTAGTTSSADNAGLRVDVTRGNTGSTSTLEGVYIGVLGGGDHANVTTTALRLGTGWEQGILIEDGGTTNSGLVYSGSGRPTKKITLAAEYAGAVLTASGSATTTGSMTSDASTSAALSNYMNYYEWSSTQTSQHNYTVAVRVKLPEDFSAWALSNAIQIYYNTELTTSDTSKMDVTIYNADTSLTAAQQATPVAYYQANVSASVNTWKTLDIDDSDLNDNGNALDAAGDVATFYIKLYSKDSNHVQVGDIVLSYLAKF